MPKAEEFREEITSKIITALETGTAPWQQPWNGAEAPRNLITKHEYNGINSVILSLAAMSMETGKNDPRWATYRQIEEHSIMAFITASIVSPGKTISTIRMMEMPKVNSRVKVGGKGTLDGTSRKAQKALT